MKNTKPLTPKEEVFRIHDRIERLNIKNDVFGGLSEKEKLERENLRVKLMAKWSEWKD